MMKKPFNIPDLFSLQGKVAVVTGGKGRYGRQIVDAIVRAGATTCLASRALNELEAMAAQYRSEGFEVRAMYVDLGDEPSIMRLKEAVLACGNGKADILVNNAVSRPMTSWADDAARFTDSMLVNSTGLFLITRAFGDEMVKTGQGGSIINIGSIQGMVGPDGTLYEGLDLNGYVPDYFFHKGGMINFTRFVASYYGRHQIRCNCISPGGLKTTATPAEFVRRYSDRTLLGRMANETDLMGAVVFLASDASLYVTGANLPVDGGYTAK